MPLPIKPEGLFHGERLHLCSQSARLWWPYFFLASNNRARLRIHYPDLLRTVFSGFAAPPTEAEVAALFREYQDNWLGFLYRDPSEGHYWCQWDSDTSTARFTATADNTSPAPPQAQFDAWRNQYHSQKAARTTPLFSFPVPHGESPRAPAPPSAPPLDTAPRSDAPLRRGEERRGEVSKNDGTAPAAAAAVVAIPLNTGQDHQVTTEDVQHLVTTYPAVDVMQQLREMRQWALDNPTRRKTARGIRAFISRWLAKEQDRAPALTGTRKPRSERGATRDASDIVQQRRQQREQNAGLK